MCRPLIGFLLMRFREDNQESSRVLYVIWVVNGVSYYEDFAFSVCPGYGTWCLWFTS